MSGFSFSSDPDKLLDYAKGYSNAKYLGLSSFVLLLYDHVICLNQEIQFLWGGGTDDSVTRSLYFLNRYIPPLVFLVQIFYQFRPNLPLNFCTPAIRTVSTFQLIGILVVEAILLIRVYHLWSHNRLVQHGICTTFVLCTGVAIAFSGKAIHDLQGTHLDNNLFGCLNNGDGLYWPIFVPTLIVQSVLFIATIIRMMRPLRTGRNPRVVKRLLRDGGIFYLAVVVPVLLTVIGSLMITRPKIAVPALLSNFILAIHSTCASHLILSINSLASELGSDPMFLLSNIEISRVAWRRGRSKNELVVDLGVQDDISVEDPSIELADIDPRVLEMAGKLRVTRSQSLGQICPIPSKPLHDFKQDRKWTI